MRKVEKYEKKELSRDIVSVGFSLFFSPRKAPKRDWKERLPLRVWAAIRVDLLFLVQTGRLTTKIPKRLAEWNVFARAIKKIRGLPIYAVILVCCKWLQSNIRSSNSWVYWKVRFTKIVSPSQRFKLSSHTLESWDHRRWQFRLLYYERVVYPYYEYPFIEC